MALAKSMDEKAEYDAVKIRCDRCKKDYMFRWPSNAIFQTCPRCGGNRSIVSFWTFKAKKESDGHATT